MSSWTSSDYTYMAEAIRLAKQGLYTTDPNPRVGCVIVKDDAIISTGWHRKAGEAHAEVEALRNANGQVEGSTVYVTLEPCSHHGRTPPCADALIKAGVARVLAAMQDPNPEVAGNGLAKLKAAGISVSVGLLEADARELNPGFINRMESGMPWVRIKLAASLDGRTAMASGESVWITGPQARSDVQRLRARSSAIVTGLGTIRHDDAALTVRPDELGLPEASAIAENQPLRVVLDQRAELSGTEKIFSLGGDVLYVVGSDAQVPQGIVGNVRVELLRLQTGKDKKLDLKALLRILAQRECNEVLVEAGATLAGGFFGQALWDELMVYMAPRLLGSNARSLMQLPLDKMDQVIDLDLYDQRFIGQDLRLTYRKTEPERG